MTDRFVILHEIEVQRGVATDMRQSLVNTSAISSVGTLLLKDGSWALSVHCSEGGESWTFLARAVDPYGQKLTAKSDRDYVLRYAMQYLNRDR